MAGMNDSIPTWPGIRWTERGEFDGFGEVTRKTLKGESRSPVSGGVFTVEAELVPGSLYLTQQALARCFPERFTGEEQREG